MSAVYPQFKVNVWFDTKTEKERYGVDIRVSRSSPWAHTFTIVEGRPFPVWFKTRTEAEAKVAERRAHHRNLRKLAKAGAA